MLKPEKNLRWMGIDMRPRGRRRVAVVVTYLVSFGTAGWLSTWRGSPPITSPVALFGLFFAIDFLTIVRGGGLVKDFQEPPSPVTFGAKGALWVKSARFLVSRTARWRVAKPDKQERMLERLEQSFPYTIQPSISANAPDEREKGEADMASRRTLQLLSVVLLYNAVSAGMQGKNWTPPEVVFMMLAYLVIARTGPRARILWREPDPRDASGEIELVQPATSR
jgi:hypothetical protein